jgi:hypothetical protein
MLVETLRSESEKSEVAKVNEYSLRLLALIWIFLGLALLLTDIAVELHSSRAPAPSPPASTSNSAISNSGSSVVTSGGTVNIEFTLLARKILEAVGIASLVFGMFSLFLELPGVRRYFFERMKELKLDQGYLNNLDLGELKKLQNNAIKAYYKNADIALEGRFLGFLNDHIYAYIDAPYRERVTLEIRYELEKDLFVAKDRLSYVCRKSSDKIIPSIVWQSDPDEIEEVRSLMVSVRYPRDGDGGLGDPILIGRLDDKGIDNNRDDKICVFDKEQGTMIVSTFTRSSLLSGKGFCINGADSYDNKDFMKVTIDAVYTVKSTHLLYWSMIYPTRDFTLVLRFPESHIIQAVSFINSAHVGELANEKGYYSFNYNSWLIPQSGVAWRLISAGEQESQPSSSSEQSLHS